MDKPSVWRLRKVRRCIKLIRRFIAVAEDDELSEKARAEQYDGFGDQLELALRSVGNEAMASLVGAFQHQTLATLQSGDDDDDEEMDDDAGDADSDPDDGDTSEENVSDDESVDRAGKNEKEFAEVQESGDGDDDDEDGSGDSTDEDEDDDDDDDDESSCFTKFEQLLVDYLQDYKFDLKAETE